MPHLYVASSKSLQSWGADVGLGKSLYLLGFCAEGTPDEAVVGLAGRDDWAVIKHHDVAADMDIAAAIRRLSAKEKWVDPAYYPALRGLDCLFKIDPIHVENALLLEAAMANGPLPSSGGKNPKIKPSVIAAYMLKLAEGA